jgi:TonB family protein
MTWQEILAQCAWRGTIILAAVFAVAGILRRGSAAMRHFVWTAAFAALLVLPLALATVPKWRWVAPAAAPVVGQVQTLGQVLVVAGSRASQLPAPLLILWTLGFAVAAGRFLLGAAGTSWMVRRAASAPYATRTLGDLRQSLGIARRVRVLETAAAPMPMMWGILRPVIVLPAGAREWQPERLHAVLLHELLHVRRLDLLAQTVAQAACCLYWFHPLAWMAARQLRRQRERACDDAVLNRGVVASEYAGHLVALVRAVAANRTRWADAPAMAEASDLESRVRSLLNRNCNRRPLTRRAGLAVAAVACAVLAALASVTAHAQAARGALAGVVRDPSGAVVPGCQVTARNLDGTNQESALANAAGEYVFAAIPAGSYTLEFRARGFAVAMARVEVPDGKAARKDGMLELGQMSEAVTVKGGTNAPKPANSVAAGAPKRIPVGGNVQPSRLTFKVDPVYPEDLQRLGVEGTVVMRAVISKEGTVLNPVVVNTGVNPGLAKAAVDAVRQWTYQPTLLNGQPVEVLTTITIDFQLAQ